MQTLEEAGLYRNPEICEFRKEEVKFQRLIVEVNGIQMNPEKVQAVNEWAAPG
jgi:hypothetical protein